MSGSGGSRIALFVNVEAIKVILKLSTKTVYF